MFIVRLVLSADGRLLRIDNERSAWFRRGLEGRVVAPAEPGLV